MGERASGRQAGGDEALLRLCYGWQIHGYGFAPTVRNEMVDFVQKELLVEKWMRAQSMLDMAAANSNRPDHGPMGAYDAWPAVTVDAMCAVGYWEKAIPFLRRTRAAIYEGAYAQAHEFYGPRRSEYDARSASHSVKAACGNVQAVARLPRP
jgi:hypothetical protein